MPEVRHQIRVRIRGEAAALAQFLAKIVKLLGVHAALEISARVIARGRMTLKINHVGRRAIVPAAKKMIESYLIKRGRRSKGRNVAAEAVMNPVRLDHHGHGVPANVTFNAAFQFAIAGVSRFGFGRDGINVRGADPFGDIHSRLAQTVGQFLKQNPRMFLPLVLENIGKNILQGFKPTFGFEGIGLSRVFHGLCLGLHCLVVFQVQYGCAACKPRRRSPHQGFRIE